MEFPTDMDAGSERSIGTRQNRAVSRNLLRRRGIGGVEFIGTAPYKVCFRDTPVGWGLVTNV